MIIGLCTLEFHLPASRNLKEKRKFLNSFRGRVRARFNVAISEVDHHDLWQRSTIGVVSIGAERDPIDRVFQKVLREAESRVDAQLIGVKVEFL
ncbi:MAG: DUF503 domain-containing protein [Acidobacteriota bacterium]|jgi:uncharacterized protein YlxP (DUF503 family)